MGMAAERNTSDSKPLSNTLLITLLASCMALILLRTWVTGSGYYLFMPWNLFLACVPLCASSLLRRVQLWNAPDLLQFGLLAIWLLFLPNAPYILTDLVHLDPDGSRLYWFDLGMLLSCAGTGLLLGYCSLFQVHKLFEARFGALCGWGVAVIALLASGYGVYLGRVQRWNSWDVITSPRGLFASIADMVLNPLQHLHIYALSGLLGVGLLAGYATLYSMMGWQRSGD
jgi:uncharacterized membrane protein